MKSRSAKNKGVRLQNTVRDMLYKHFCSLQEGDIKTAIMGESGEDIIFSPAARSLFPFHIECKNTERANIWDWVRQAQSYHDKDWLVVFKRNRSDIYCCLRFDRLLELLKEDKK